MELKPGYKQTEVRAIPADWKVVLLDSVARRGSGHTPDKKHPEYWDGDIKWISLKDSDRLDALYIEETAAKITPAGIANSSATMYPAGTVVLSRDAGVGKSAIMKADMAVSQHFMAWQCSPSLDNHFLYYWLQAEKAEFERIAMGNTIKTIGLPYFKKLCVPLPHCDEQRTIAGALGNVDALLGALTQLIAKKRNLKQAAMQQLLTGNKRLPGFTGQWELKLLGDAGTCLRGVSYNGDSDLSAHDTDHTTRLLRANNVRDATVVTSDVQFVNIARVSSNQMLRKDDILICMANGSKALVGKAGRFTVNDGYQYTFGAFMGCFRTNSLASNSNFVFYLFQTGRYRNYINNLLAGSSINNLRPSSIESLGFLFPSIAEQTAIAAVLTDMDAELAALEQRRAKTRALKRGMMQELLTGRIRLV
ncbi:MAG: restriction endonuclease subunit S [Pyrinomonadaceae bacterium]|nr:restriction endonuclease subunit S [Pyrinomonadaceae bacterium]